MENLYEKSEAVLRSMGITSLPCALLDSTPAGLRFQIGGSEDIYLADHRRPNGAYVENAVDRALALYARLPAAPDLLRIDECPGFTAPGLSAPNLCCGDSSYWEIGANPPFLTKLLREIVRAELDPTGTDTLVSNVYFMSTRLNFIFQLYDDRGADLVAADPEVLRSLLDTFGDWIMDRRL